MELISQAELARRRGCSRSDISQKVKSGQLKLYDGKINFEEAIAALDKKQDRDADPHAPDFWKEKARFEKLRADEKDLVVKKMLAELVPIEDVRKVLSKIISAARTRFLSLPRKLVVHLPVKYRREFEGHAKREVNEILMELSAEEYEDQDSTTKPNKKPAPRRRKPLGTAARSKPKRVGKRVSRSK